MSEHEAMIILSIFIGLRGEVGHELFSLLVQLELQLLAFHYKLPVTCSQKL
jgi:hypothetical protein